MLPSSLLLELFLVAVIRNMPWKRRYIPQRVDVELFVNPSQLFVSLLAGRIPDFASSLALVEDWCVLGYLGPLWTLCIGFASLKRLFPC